ncbi:MAG: 1-deoxy-D-xylulose-5-phosphate reductoisomerase [Chloroflexi bacterium]|nr:1-deoxy-D-xylulose-5-phosphate reductoisomerase [Chloroflexota bacterium]
MRSIVILGSTGSIGTQTLEVVRQFPDQFNLVGLAGGANLALLKEQVKEFRPQLVAAGVSRIPWLENGAVTARRVAIEEMAAYPGVDLVVMATSGSAGLKPTLAAIDAGKDVALANKEVLVMAGHIIMPEAQKRGVSLLPVDSEHSAIWQCLWGEHAGVHNGVSAVSRIILTASGGPFRGMSREEMARVTPGDALRHPTWRMGKKVTIDSATLFNKGMEIIEAHWLFGLPYSGIEVVIHPESIVHSMVEFCDGSVKAQLSFPDMRLPIQLALSYPARWPGRTRRLNFSDLRSLTFEPPDESWFPCLRLARQAGERGGTFPAVASAADEVATELFLAGKLGFNDIARLIEGTLDAHQGTETPDIEAVMAADRWARQTARRLAKEPVC